MNRAVQLLAAQRSGLSEAAAGELELAVGRPQAARERLLRARAARTDASDRDSLLRRPAFVCLGSVRA